MAKSVSLKSLSRFRFLISVRSRRVVETLFATSRHVHAISSGDESETEETVRETHFTSDTISDKPDKPATAATREDVTEEGEYINPLTGERGGPRGPEPTRYGDWERKGRVSDF
ncbi:uncharacterized protein LOC134192469 [Corticium candelabrum]|uniref:uncharacterized protein LOC134192469 n=1 Tax=Corticium candelabrum TaxID=121492 RepID=UPI002E26A9A0|nr:uncharacterized protein LOC134192469 [Corticium candelabrum]